MEFFCFPDSKVKENNRTRSKLKESVLLRIKLKDFFSLSPKKDFFKPENYFQNVVLLRTILSLSVRSGRQTSKTSSLRIF